MKPVTKPGNLPCICRIDQPGQHTHGWYLRVGYRGAGRGFAKLFSDGVYGGKAESLVAAVAKRDEILGLTTTRMAA